MVKIKVWDGVRVSLFFRLQGLVERYRVGHDSQEVRKGHSFVLLQLGLGLGLDRLFEKRIP